MIRDPHDEVQSRKYFSRCGSLNTCVVVPSFRKGPWAFEDEKALVPGSRWNRKARMDLPLWVDKSTGLTYS